MKIVSLPESWRGRALVISAVSDPESWFAEDERAVIESFALPKRRMEWMLSRIAEKELRNRGAHGDYISYSHSAAYGGAAIDFHPVGIDVQTLRDIAEAAAHHFLTDAEIDAMRRCTIAHRLLHFWCAKEAAWKQHRGEVATLRRVPISLIDEGERGLRFAGVATWAVDDLVAALTLPTS
jgi:hypothetical protein